jgi:sugar transferase (PEP-CTERM/EpsH1 system associated)
MKVLALTHRTPFPPDKGDKIRTHHLLTRLARRAEVHLCAFAEPPSDVAHAGLLARAFASVALVPLDLRVQKARALPWALTATPLTLPVFRSGAMFEAVARVVAAVRPDVIVAESTSMAPYALAHPEVPLVMDFVDADSAKWRAYADKAPLLQRAVYLREAITLARYERHVAERARVSLVTAERERVLMQSIAPGCDIRALPNGVDVDHFTPRAALPAEPSAVFFGAMDYHANAEAAVMLVREVLPRLRRRHAGFRVVIAGAKPTPEVRALGEVAGVTVTGYVDDIRPHVQGASVCVIPLRVARGVQNKVLEAMAMGVPVVASPGAAEGIDATAGDDLLVARVDDGGAAVADAVSALIDDPTRLQAVAARARRVVTERYGWEPRAEALRAICAEATRR